MQTPKDQSSDRRVDERRASLSTLSKYLGLSPAAISRVLNGAPAARSIPQATQDRIFEAARELNYRPNVLARSLRRGQSMTLGVLVPEIVDGYSSLVLSGVEEGLLQAGYFYLLISHHHRLELVENSLSMLSERAVDGLVAIDTPLPQQVRVPSATVSRSDRRATNTSIVLDNERAAELAISHLAELGHREIAIIKGQAYSSDTEFRWSAIQRALAAHALPHRPSLITQLEGAPSHEPGYLATVRLLASGARFSALFAFNDISAIGAIRALREEGLRVPEDVSVIGFDDISSAAYQNPSLTTVRQPLQRMGLLAAESVLTRINGKGTETASELIQVDPELVVRESTAPPPEQFSKQDSA